MGRVPLSGHNLHTLGWGDMKMKGQPNRDSNPVPPSQGSNHATDWANIAGLMLWYGERSIVLKSSIMICDGCRCNWAFYGSTASFGILSQTNIKILLHLGTLGAYILH